MMNEKQIKKEFEKEIWLYLDNDLSEDRMHYWRKIIDENTDFKKEIESIELVSNLYNKTTTFDIDDLAFNKIIDKTISRKNFFLIVKNYLLKLLSQDTEYLLGKVAFASLLIVFAVIASLNTNKPNPTKTLVNTVKSEILEWDATSINNQIDKIETLLLLAKNDNYKKYYVNKVLSNEWNKNTYEIENKIEKIKNDVNNKKF